MSNTKPSSTISKLFDELKFSSLVLKFVGYIKSISISTIDAYPGLTDQEKTLAKVIHGVVFTMVINDENMKILFSIINSGKKVAVSLFHKLSKEFKNEKYKHFSDKVMKGLKNVKSIKDQLEQLDVKNINFDTMKIVKGGGRRLNKEGEVEVKKDEMLYKQKALKYKQKYMELKNRKDKESKKK